MQNLQRHMVKKKILGMIALGSDNIVAINTGLTVMSVRSFLIMSDFLGTLDKRGRGSRT